MQPTQLHCSFFIQMHRSVRRTGYTHHPTRHVLSLFHRIRRRSRGPPCVLHQSCWRMDARTQAAGGRGVSVNIVCVLLMCKLYAYNMFLVRTVETVENLAARRHVLPLQECGRSPYSHTRPVRHTYPAQPDGLARRNDPHRHGHGHYTLCGHCNNAQRSTTDDKGGETWYLNARHSCLPLWEWRSP